MECVFCNIIQGKIPAQFVYQDDEVVVFHDIHPKARVHVLIVPIAHIASVNEITEKNRSSVGRMFVAASRVAEELGVKESGYKLLVNVGEGAGQVVPHLHMHLLGDNQELPRKGGAP